MHICISGRDVQKVIPSVVILRERRGNGGESFVVVVNSQRYKYSSSGTFIAIHIQLRYVSTVKCGRRALRNTQENTCAFRPFAMVWCCMELQGCCVVGVRRQKDVLR